VLALHFWGWACTHLLLPPVESGAENEARAFAKSEGWETEDVEEIALRVRCQKGMRRRASVWAQHKAGQAGCAQQASGASPCNTT
jgi:hypothetical protein